MTIQEAILSGKNFRRDQWVTWYSNDDTKIHKFSQMDLMATDWEVEQEKVEITKERAIRAYRKFTYWNSQLGMNPQEQEFLSDLGFKL